MDIVLRNNDKEIVLKKTETNLSIDLVKRNQNVQLNKTGRRGPSGESLPGPQGPAGPQGIQGERGETGPQGADGAVGAQGEQGPQGIKGEDGIQGPQGATGATGIQGPVGPQGLKGDTGTQGPQGPAGAQGVKGDTGEQGPIGLTGEQGEVGPQGSKGDTGAQGIQGVKGDKGDTGPAGPSIWGGISGDIATQTDLQNALNLKANDNSVVHLAGAETITGEKTFGANLSLSDAVHINTGTTTGSQIATSTTQRIGFHGATPSVQQTATTDLGTVLSTKGLRASGTNYPITTSGALNLTGAAIISGNRRETPANITANITISLTSAMRQRVSPASNITITLPNTASAGHVYKFLRVDNTANTVTFTGTFIGGTPALNAQGKWVEIVTTTVAGTYEVWGNN